MTNRGLSKLGLQTLDRLGDRFPASVPALFQRTLLALLGNEALYRNYRSRYGRMWRSVPEPKKLLYVVDVCIGDAVLGIQTLRTLREFYPSAEMHYACHITGGELVEGIPGGVSVHRLIRGEKGFPTYDDLKQLGELCDREGYDLVLNMSPFIRSEAFGKRRVVPLYVPYTAFVLRAWKQGRERHVSLLARQFVIDMLADAPSGTPTPRDPERLNANEVYLPASAIAAAEQFLTQHGLEHTPRLLFWNPDATSQYGQIPFELQCDLLARIAASPRVSAVLVGKAFTNRGVEERLVAALPQQLLSKVLLVPHMPITHYTALIDRCDMFISGDTGPLHIASCRKISTETGQSLRNRTAVAAIYGATDSKMYGYDSVSAHHVPANQDVASRSFSGETPCRNITCINKFGKHCAEVRCFDNFPASDVLSFIERHFADVMERELITISIPRADAILG